MKLRNDDRRRPLRQDHTSTGTRPGVLAARERLAQYGPNTLTDSELLTILVGPETPDAVLAKCGTVQALPQESPEELAGIAGVTPRRAAVITAAVELGRRTMRPASTTRVQLRNPQRIAEYLMPEHGGHAIERFGIINLDTKHRVLRTKVLTTGTIDSTIVDPRLVFSTAAAHRAASIVLFHNHPSGDPEPSYDDISLTARLVEAGQLMGIEVLDHIILAASGEYRSFKTMGRI